MEGREWLLLMWSPQLFRPGDDSGCAPTVAQLPTMGENEPGGQLFQVGVALLHSVK